MKALPITKFLPKTLYLFAVVSFAVFFSDLKLSDISFPSFTTDNLVNSRFSFERANSPVSITDQ
jgi:hypothetical protein